MPFLVLAIALALRLASSGTANLSYLLIAAYALRGRGQAIQALALSWLFTMLNSELAPEASVASMGRYLVIFAAAISVAWRSGSVVVNKLSLFTLLLGALMLVHSLLFSAVMDISVLKVVSWMAVVLTLLSAWQSLPAAQLTALFDQLQWGLIWLMLLSLPLLAIPSIGYAVNGAGFQGLLNQPQAFGPTAALVGAMLGGRVLGVPKPRWRDLALLGMCVVLIVLSEARTAGLAWVLGLIGSVVLSPVFAGKSWRCMLPGLHSRRLVVVGLALFVAIVVSGPVLVGQLSSYLFKRTDAASFVDAAETSRGILVFAMLDNIQAHPLTGIGFGIASIPELMVVERDPLLGLPLGAPIEKGVMPIAVLEELGVFGAVAVLSWLLIVLRRGAKAGVTQFSVILTLLLVNFGEYMFFSVGGMGILLLILLTGAVTVKDRGTGTTDHA